MWPHKYGLKPLPPSKTEQPALPVAKDWSEAPAAKAAASVSQPEARQQLNVTLPVSLLARLRYHAGTHFGATIQGTVEAALIEYLDRQA